MCIITDVYSLAILYNSFSQIDLSSLEEVGYGGVFWFQNNDLCYVGDLGLYVNRDTFNGTGTLAVECPSPSNPRRRDSDTCSE